LPGIFYRTFVCRYFLFAAPGFLANFFAGAAFFANFRGVFTFDGTGNVDARSVVAGAKLAGSTLAVCGDIDSKMRSIVSIFVFMAPI